MLPLDHQFRILKGVLEYWYGDRVAVDYCQHSVLDDDKLRRAAPPLPAVAIGGRMVLRGQILVQDIIDELNRLGVVQNRPENPVDGQ